MTTQNNANIGPEPADELVVTKLLNEMVLAERWDLTDLGHAYLQEARVEDAEILERLQGRDERRVNNILANR